jgi:FKBP-type peptidyl-prolyl cis-trans isomerase SlpA
VPGAHLTLHYRLSLADGSKQVITTFGGAPATLTLGLGQLAEPLEAKLMGLEEGVHTTITMAPGEAFGQRNPELVQTITREVLKQNSFIGENYAPGDLVNFPGPNGAQFAAVLKDINERHAVFDFNHPLAGQAVSFEVKIIGIL